MTETTATGSTDAEGDGGSPLPAPRQREPLPPRRGRAIARRTITLGGLACATGTTVAAGIVVTLLVVVLPTPEGTSLVSPLTISLAAGYYALALVVGVWLGARRTRARLSWLVEGRRPTDRERRRALGIPFAATRIAALLWLGAAVLFSLVTAPTSVLLAVEVGTTVLIGGLASTVVAYIGVEVANRPVVATALRDRVLAEPQGAGVAWRTVLAWLLGTGLPLVGLVLLGGLAIPLDIERDDLAIAVFVIGLVDVLAGLGLIALHARSMAHPLRTLRAAVDRLNRGERGVTLQVTDSGEIGVLQTAFNRLAAGLDERDRLRDLFGRHVGEDVARRALDEGVELGGEEREVVVLYVDVTGSTALAEQERPTAVVERLNRLFAVVLDAVAAERGTVTAFAGDAAVCVWNAPTQHPAPAAAALRAAVTMRRTLAADPEALPVGIGVAGGHVVAGNVGSDERFEYTVIGDAVNTAARLSDLAKERDVTVLADAALLDAARDATDGWSVVGEATLRGRRSPTRLAVPPPEGHERIASASA